MPSRLTWVFSSVELLQFVMYMGAERARGSAAGEQVYSASATTGFFHDVTDKPTLQPCRSRMKEGQKERSKERI